MKICFIACSSLKKKGEMPAYELYQGALFKKSFLYSKKNFDKIYILSAKYGLIKPEEVIRDYDLTLNNFNNNEIKKWSLNIMSNLKNEISIKDDLYFFCGERYRRFLIKWLPNNKKIPLEHLSIGKALSWFKNKI